MTDKEIIADYAKRLSKAPQAQRQCMMGISAEWQQKALVAAYRAMGGK